MRQDHGITIELNTSNAAFDDFQGGEIARILEALAVKFENGMVHDTLTDDLRDINGNIVGRILIKAI